MTLFLIALAVVNADTSAGSAHRHTAFAPPAPQSALLDFTATWCGPCQQMAPIVSRLERQGFPIRKVDIDQEKALAQKYGVSSIPCFVLVVNGREVNRIVGRTSEAELRQLCQQIPVNPPEEIADNPRPSGSKVLPNGLETTPVTTSSEPPKKSEKKGILPNIFGRKSDPKPPSFDDAEFRGNTPAGEGTAGPTADPQTASVRIKVRDAKGVNFGTGSVIDSKPGRTLILTCGHLFRGVQPDSTIDVDVFEGKQVRKYVGRIVQFDLTSEVGLITIPTEGTLPTVTVAPLNTATSVNERLFSIGCSQGETPSKMVARVLHLNKYEGADNIECSGEPVPGRSGGGLFKDTGELVGICFAADEKTRSGLYTGLRPIYTLLQKAKVLPESAEPPAGNELAGGAGERPPAGRATRAMPDEAGFGAAAGLGDLGADLADAISGDVPDADTMREAEVVCIIRPKDAKLGTRVVIIHRASSRFVNYLQGEVKGGPKPTAAHFPFDPTMNLSANLAEIRKQQAGTKTTPIAQAPRVEAPAAPAKAPVFERYRRSPESR